jgi:hypothetical protein
MDPVLFEKDPAGQKVQEVEPLSTATLPGAQGVHAEARELPRLGL